jgi:phage tail protein X
MSGTFETVTVESEGVTVPRIVWRRFRRPMPGLVEAVLDANPGLAALGAYLPVGTVVRLPIPAARGREPDVRLTRLWD